MTITINKKFLVALICISILLGVTNPSKELYVIWAKNKLIEGSKDNTVGALVSLFAPPLIDGATTTANFGVVTIFSTEFGNQKYVTLGIVNNFIVLHHEQFKDIKDNKAVVVDKQSSQSATESSSQNLGQDKIIGYKTYKNGRYGFSIDYPRNFISSKPPANGDGLLFNSPDGQVQLVVSGGNNSGSTIKDYFLNTPKGKIAYSNTGDNWFVVTWEENDKIVYCKMFVGSNSHNSFIFTYPKNKKDQYDEVVTNLEKTFKAGEINKAW